MRKNIIYIIVTIFCLIIFGFWYTNKNKAIGHFSFEESRATPFEETIQENIEPLLIKVHIAGAVNNPGVYELPDGSRIDDVVTLAGGVSHNADLEQINLSEFIKDAQKIRIPVEGEILDNSALYNTQSESTLININTASERDLTSLPGIGDVRASDIVKYREKNGGFKNIDEIKNITGIKDKTFDKIKDLITIK